MKIANDETKLTIDIDFWSEMSLKIWLTFIVTLILGGLFWLQWIQTDDIEARSMYITLAIMGVLVLLAIYIASDVDKIYKCGLNKSLGKASIEKRVAWRLWFPRKIEIPLDAIRLVVVAQEPSPNRWNLDNGLKMYLDVKGHGRLQFGESATTKDGEVIGKFLQVPLRIELESETITIIPWDEDVKANLTPTPCSSCGAPLPSIHPSMRSIACSHCDMTYSISWQDERPVLRAIKGKSLFKLKSS